jgi:hypothetical protein
MFKNIVLSFNKIFTFFKKKNKERKRIRNKLMKDSKKKLILNSLKSDSAVQSIINTYNVDNYLSRLCELHGTDKGFVNLNKDTPFSWEPHPYSVFYNNLFFHCRENIKLIFECGIGTNNTKIESHMTKNGKPGASLRMWRDYFVNAHIFGGDIDSEILFQDDRISTFEVDQLNTSSINKLWKNINKNNFDLIIDDGLHSYDAALNFFLNSIEKLKDGGLYIIEDIDFEYLEKLKNRLRDFNPEIIMLNNNYSERDDINNNNLIVIRKN